MLKMVWKEKYHSRPTALPKVSPEIWYLKVPPRLTAPIELKRVNVCFQFCINEYILRNFRSFFRIFNASHAIPVYLLFLSYGAKQHIL